MKDPLQQKAFQLSSEITQKKDSLIREALCTYFGHAMWALDELIGRVNCNIIQSTQVETYTIDGIPILEVHPVEFPEEDGKMSAAFKYRKLI